MPTRVACSAIGLLGLLLGADEHHRAAVGDGLLDELVGAVDVGQRLLQVDDVDAVALGEDEALHLRVPAAGLVPEVHAALEQLLHGDDLVGGHGRPAFLAPRPACAGGLAPVGFLAGARSAVRVLTPASALAAVDHRGSGGPMSAPPPVDEVRWRMRACEVDPHGRVAACECTPGAPRGRNRAPSPGRPTARAVHSPASPGGVRGPRRCAERRGMACRDGCGRAGC